MRRVLLFSLTTMVILSLILTGCSSHTVNVSFSDQNKQMVINASPDETLSEALESKGLNIPDLQKKYQSSIPWNQKLNGQTNITLACKCQVNLQVGGQDLGTFTTLKPTVGEFLQEHKVNLTEWDQLHTPINKKITDGMTIVVDRVEPIIKKKVESIPFKTEEKKSDKLAKGTQETDQEGKQGKKIYEVMVYYKNGQQLIEDGQPKMLKKLVEMIHPVSKVVLIGTNTESKSTPSTATTSSAASMTVESTGYTHSGGRTATGVWPKRGTIAVDPSVIPLGTKLYVPGYGYGVAQDTGGAIKGNIIDLFFETRSECIKWGRRTVQIQILK